MGVYVGVDLGGTKTIVAACNKQGKILHRTQDATPLDLEQGLRMLQAMIQRVTKDQPIAGMGAAVGGPLDWHTGIVSPLHQPQWREVPLKKIMEEKWNCPFHVDVDTNIAALGEYHSTNETVRRFLYITLSTGMGGGFLLNGKIYRGLGDEHPEIGHQSIHFRCTFPERMECECGAPDCLEGLISGNAIRRIYLKSPEYLSQREWDEVAYNLGQGLRNLAAIYLPEVIVLGGGVSLGGGEKLVQNASSVMAQYLHIIPVPEVRMTSLGQDTALIGALTLAIHGMD